MEIPITTLYPIADNRWATRPDPAGLPTVFAFDNCPESAMAGDDHSGVAIAEDGTCLAGHWSSSHAWCKLDMGRPYEVTLDEGTEWRPQEPISVAKHALYAAHYPGGYVFEWVPTAQVVAHPGLSAAYALNQAAEAAAGPPSG